MKKTITGMLCIALGYCFAVRAQEVAPGRPQSAASMIGVVSGIEMLGDRKFNQGLEVWKPAPGKKVLEGVLDFGNARAQPVWEIAQWSSKYDILTAKLKVGAKGEKTYANAGKNITVWPDGAFSLEVIGQAEYGDSVRKKMEYWPHLYLTQDLKEKRTLAGFTKIQLIIEAKKLYCDNLNGEKYNPGLHTAQIMIQFFIKNMNHASLDYGRYYIISLPVFDYRYDYRKKTGFLDNGGKKTFTNAYVCGPDGKELWDGPLKDGKWHRLNADILPYMKDGFAEAQARGFLTNSKLADMQIGSYVLGWEVTGTFNTAMMFRNMSMKAVPGD